MAAAMEAPILVATLGGPTMFARIGVMKALNRHVERLFNPDRKQANWGKRRLLRDRSLLPDGNFPFTVALRAPWWEYPTPQLFRLLFRLHGQEAGPVAARALPLLDWLFRPGRLVGAHRFPL
jgi:hypothetical protein